MSRESEESREKLIKRLAADYERKLRERLVVGPQTFDDIEKQAQVIGESVKGTLVDEISKDCGSGYVGSRAFCACGRVGNYKQMRERHVIGLHGVTRVNRACYYCPHCRQGFSPLDKTLNLGPGQCSRATQALIARFCSFLPFNLAAQEMEIVCGVKLSATTIQRYAKQIGQNLQRDWDRRQELLRLGKVPTCAKRPSRLYGSMDGAVIHVGGQWREAKLGAVYQRASGGGIDCAHYYATMGNSEEFGPKFTTLAYQNGAQYCRDIAMVADGAKWIWQVVGKRFPRSVQVLDYYHVTEHLWEAADARFGPGSPLGAAWMEQQKALLLSDGIADVISNVEGWAARKLMDRDIKRKLAAYLTEHKKRATYETFAKNGYHIGSGIIEAGCKTVVKARMGGAGMRWETKGAEAMLHICAHWRSSGQSDFMRYTS